MIGKGREALEETYTHDITLPPAERSAGGAEGRAGCRSPAACSDVSFEVRAGEVLGIYGFMGCGQLELARILFGKLRPDSGTLAVAGNRKAFGSTATARRAGIAFVPESRRAMLFHQEPVYKNISISILDRISALLLKPVARAVDRHAAGRAIADQARRRSSSSSACCPAATSRRSRWRNG